MKRFLVVAVAVLAALHASADAKFRRSSRPAQGRYIVMLQPQGTHIDVPVQALSKTYGGEVEHLFRGAPWEGYSVKNLPEAAALALSRDPRVLAVEEDTVGELQQVTPQHPQWGLDRTNQRSLPLDNVTSAGCLGAPYANIYIMDTGITDPTGTEFGTRLIDGYKDPAIASFRDDVNHGTSVASIAAGAKYGVAYTAKVVNVKVFQNGGGFASWAIAAIRDFINVHSVTGPKVVNISARYTDVDSGTPALAQEILNSIATYNITYVGSAGASDVDACTGGVPERLGQTNGMITVGSTYLINNYTTDARSHHPSGDGNVGPWMSNWGPCVDIFAPGTRVGAMGMNGAFREFSGTSASAPYVAGAAARDASVHYSSYGTIPSPASVESSVKADGTANVIDPATIGANSPNLLLYRFFMRCRSV